MLIIILHEIYGGNDFIKQVSVGLEAKGFDTYVPNLIDRASFCYEDSEKAYEFYMDPIIRKMRQKLPENKYFYS